MRIKNSVFGFVLLLITASWTPPFRIPVNLRQQKVLAVWGLMLIIIDNVVILKPMSILTVIS